MSKYIMRSICTTDYAQVARIYNSNIEFLLSHLGVDSIDEDFVSQEVLSMSEAGFATDVIIDSENDCVVGLVDYKIDKEVYLSLFMLAAELQRKVIGSQIYLDFQWNLLQKKCTSIRIDVVNDYSGNAVPFWSKLGFSEDKNITLLWRNKKSNAVVMRKNIGD